MKKILILALTSLVMASLSFTVSAAEPIKIAFVDSGNTGRSLTAELISDKIIKQKKLHIAVISRADNMDPYDTKPEPNAAILWKKRGVNISAHRSVPISIWDIKHSDYIITMSQKHNDRILAMFPEAKGKVFTFAQFLGDGKDVEDAWGKPMADYKVMFKQLDAYIPKVLDKAVSQAKK